MTNDLRRAAIVRLLETMNDGLPVDPRGQWQGFGAVPGEKATKRTPCRSCDETGTVNTRAGQEPCERCDSKGWYLVDAYTGRRENEPVQARVGQMTGSEREEWRHRTDALIERTRRQLTRPASELEATAETTPFRWERERARMFRMYDYRALFSALELLRDVDAGCAAVVVAVYTRDLVAPSVTLEAAVERGLRFIDRLMPDPVRAPGVEFKHPALVRRDRRRQEAA